MTRTSEHFRCPVYRCKVTREWCADSFKRATVLCRGCAIGDVHARKREADYPAAVAAPVPLRTKPLPPARMCP